MILYLRSLVVTHRLHISKHTLCCCADCTVYVYMCVYGINEHVGTINAYICVCMYTIIYIQCMCMYVYLHM